jgi:membrane-bound metal-dependent hydrolase YbcI (DUF457 family)
VKQLVPGVQHQGASHGVGAAVIAGCVALAVFRQLGLRAPGRLALAVGAAWLSHIALDYLNLDGVPPIGLMALWPLSSDHYKFPWPIFLDIGRQLDWRTLRHNLLAAAWECVVLAPLLLFSWRRRRPG